MVATQIFFIFTPIYIPGEMIPMLTVAYFSDGLVKNHQLENNPNSSKHVFLCLFFLQALLTLCMLSGGLVMGNLLLGSATS